MNDFKRIETLALHLAELECDALLIEHPIHIFYLTGLDLSAGKLVVTPQSSALIVDGRYFEMCQQNSPCPVYLLDQLSLKEWLLEHAILTLAFESETTSYQAYLRLKKMVDEISDKAITLKPTASPLIGMRSIKDAAEIHMLSEAAMLCYQGYEFVASHLQEGITEIELEIELEYFWRKKGATKVSFVPIIAFGPNSSMPHHRAGPTRLEKGVPVLIDIGVCKNHYHSDMTRTLFFGDVAPEVKTIYTIVEAAKQKALDLCRPGVLIGQLDRAARDVITSEGYGDFFTHSLGHGIGLEVHEAPALRKHSLYNETPLQPGMVVTIEPGIYLPGLGGVRLEDTIVITQDGHRTLTRKEP
jgi:Xaa-Pro aminopeptidase